jgi:two-component system LytT family sensor kinase
MRSRRLVAGSMLVFLVIGLFRGTVQSWLRRAGPLDATELMIAAIALSWIWVPVALAADWTWRKHWPRRTFAAFHVLASACMCVIEPLWLVFLRRSQGLDVGPISRNIMFRLDTNLLFYVSVVGATWAIERRRTQASSELAASELERALANAQLHVLTLQLHPHFLFNTLNLISQLAYESVAEALRTLGNLRALLVRSLEHANQREVSLRDELGFLNAYLEIQEGRFRERLRVTIDTSAECLPAAVPHLLLQPLVENAIIHAVAPRATPGHIRVAIRRAGDRLRIEISDDGPGVVLPVREGLGLGNTRLRLGQLFAADYRLTIARNGAAGTIVAVDIPYRVAFATAREREPVTADLDVMTEERPARLAARGGLRRALPFIQVVAGWAAVAALWTELESLEGTLPTGPFTLSGSMMTNGINVGLWIILTPFVAWLARRIDLSRSAHPARIFAHLILGSIVATAHSTAFLAIVYLGVHGEYHKRVNQSFDWLLWDFAAYAGIVAFSTVISLSARQRDTRLAIAANRARLTHATIASMRLRLQPGILLGGLDAIAAAIGRDAERSEPAIARMGDFLRGLLRSAEDEQLPLADELSLLRAYLDVLGAAGREQSLPLDVDLPLATTAKAFVPALATVSLVAVIGGAVDGVAVSRTTNAIVTRVQSASGTIDQSRFTDLDRRLRSAGGPAHRMEVRAGAGGIVLELVLPLRDDELSASDPTSELLTA